jgi:hypothetical protein
MENSGAPRGLPHAARLIRLRLSRRLGQLVVIKKSAGRERQYWHRVVFAPTGASIGYILSGTCEIAALQRFPLMARSGGSRQRGGMSAMEAKANGR